MRLASLGLVDGFSADLIVSGINHGSNLGDDITYSGTVAAALEGVVLGIPGIAVSQQSQRARDGLPARRPRSTSTTAAAFTARVVDELDDVPLPEGTLLNVNVPAGEVDGVEVVAARQAHLPRPARRSSTRTSGRKLYRIYGDAPGHDDEPGTDLAAIAAGRIAVTPLHFDLTDRAGHRDAAGVRPRAPARAGRARSRE